jgi:hypothetical protein
MLIDAGVRLIVHGPMYRELYVDYAKVLGEGPSDYVLASGQAAPRRRSHGRHHRRAMVRHKGLVTRLPPRRD